MFGVTEEKFHERYPARPADDGCDTPYGTFFDTVMCNKQIVLRRVPLTKEEIRFLVAKKKEALKSVQLWRPELYADPFPYLEFAYEVELLTRIPPPHPDLKARMDIGKWEMWSSFVPSLGLGRNRDTGSATPIREYYPAKFLVFEAAYAHVNKIRDTASRLLEAKREELRLQSEHRRMLKRQRELPEVHDVSSSPPPFQLPPPPPPPPILELQPVKKQRLTLRELLIQPPPRDLVQATISPYFRLLPPADPLKKKSHRDDPSQDE